MSSAKNLEFFFLSNKRQTWASPIMSKFVVATYINQGKVYECYLFRIEKFSPKFFENPPI